MGLFSKLMGKAVPEYAQLKQSDALSAQAQESAGRLSDLLAGSPELDEAAAQALARYQEAEAAYRAVRFPQEEDEDAHSLALCAFVRALLDDPALPEQARELAGQIRETKLQALELTRTALQAHPEREKDDGVTARRGSIRHHYKQAMELLNP